LRVNNKQRATVCSNCSESCAEHFDFNARSATCLSTRFQVAYLSVVEFAVLTLRIRAVDNDSAAPA
jgi:hypothetical protein